MMCPAVRRQKQRHWAVEMEGKVEELAKQHDAVQAQRVKLAAHRTSLEVRAPTTLSISSDVSNMGSRVSEPSDMPQRHFRQCRQPRKAS